MYSDERINYFLTVIIGAYKSAVQRPDIFPKRETGSFRQSIEWHIFATALISVSQPEE